MKKFTRPDGTEIPKLLAAPPPRPPPFLLFQPLTVHEEGPPMVEGNLPLSLETLTKPADNRKQSLLERRSLRGANLTHSPCHAPGQAAEETTGGARESIQIPEGCAELCWLFQAHDSYLPAVLLSGEESRRQHVHPSHFFLCCGRTSSYRVSAGSHRQPSPFVTLKRWAASKEEQHKKCFCPSTLLSCPSHIPGQFRDSCTAPSVGSCCRSMSQCYRCPMGLSSPCPWWLWWKEAGRSVGCWLTALSPWLYSRDL